MSSPAADRLAHAFGAWLDAQRQAVELVRAADHPGAPEDWAEGFRWIGRIAALAFDWVVEKNDPLRPVLFRAQDEYRKLIVDNPDVAYGFTVLAPGETYRLSGTRGEAAYVGLTIGTEIFRWGSGGPAGTLGQYHLDQFDIDGDGRFEILLGGAPRERNWIPLHADAGHLAIRETFFDRARDRPAELRFERLGAKLPAPRAEPEDLAARVEVAASFFLFVVQVCVGMWAGSAANRNRFAGASGGHHVAAKEDDVRSHSDTDMVYQGGRWQIGEGEALEIVVRPPPYDFLYWGLVIVNPWMESYDYRYATTATNNRRATRRADGTWRVIVAASDPGVPNWLDTGGRREGFMLVRWVLAGESPPAPECRVVPISSLAQTSDGTR